jgi:hypothetical protein
VILKNGKDIAHGKVDELLNFSQVAIIETPQMHELENVLAEMQTCKILERNVSGL